MNFSETLKKINTAINNIELDKINKFLLLISHSCGYQGKPLEKLIT